MINIPKTYEEAINLDNGTASEIFQIIIDSLDPYMDNFDLESLIDKDASWFLGWIIKFLEKISNIEHNPFTTSRTTWYQIVTDFVKVHNIENTGDYKEYK
jgi:hypothetical protein